MNERGRQPDGQTSKIYEYEWLGSEKAQDVKEDQGEARESRYDKRI